MKRALPSIIAVALIVVAFGFLFGKSAATGAVEGRIVFHRDSRPQAHAWVSLYRDSDYTRYSTETDAQGRFRFSHIPVGQYHLADSTQHHHLLETGVTVHEAETATREGRLITDEPAISLAYTQQKIFASHELPKLAVTGIGRQGEKVAITAYRTRLSDIMRLRQGESALTELGQRWGDNDPSKLAKALQPFTQTPTVQAEEAIARADSEGFYSQRVALPAACQRPGLYLVRLDYDQKRVWTWVLVTDTALITYESPKDKTITAYVVGLESGTPRPGATVRVLVQGQEKARATTDKDGLARLPLDTSLPANQHEVVVAAMGDDEALVTKETANSERDGGLVGHILTDRPLYRPGHTVHYKALLRRPTPGKDYAYRIPSGERAVVTITDPNDLELQRETLTVSPNGTVSGTFTVNPEATTGFYHIRLQLGADELFQSVELASYRKPEFEVTVTPKATRVHRGEQIEATVKAKYYFGAPVAGAKVSWSSTHRRDWAADDDGDLSWRDDDDESEESSPSGEFGDDGTVTLDANGEAVISLPARANESYSKEPTTPPQVEDFTISANVIDSAERVVEASATVKVTTADIRLVAETEGYLLTVGKPMRLFVTARNHDGKPAAGVPVRVILEREQPKPKEEPKGRRRRRRSSDEPVMVAIAAPLTGTTGADGRVILSYTPTQSGDLSLTANGTDNKGKPATTHLSLWVSSDNDRERGSFASGLTLATDKKHYEPGETAKVVIGSPVTGQTALVTVEGERLYDVRPVPIKKTVTVLQVPVKPEYGPNVALHVSYVYQKQYAHSEAPLRVSLPQKTLTVTLTPEKAQYEPGQTAVFDVALKDASGKPVAGEFCFSLADEAIYALKNDDPKALKKTFYPHRISSIRTQHSFELVYLAGDEKDGPQIVARKKFVDTAYWNAALTTDASGHTRVSIPLPDNLTTWRATVNASTLDTAVGFGRAKIVVNRPFFVRLDTPRFVVEGDQVRLLGLVHNNTGAAQTVHVRLDGPGLKREEKTLSVAPGTVGEATWQWTVPAATEPSGKLTLSGWTDDRRYTDGVEQPITLRPFTREEQVNVAADAQGTLTVALSAEAVADRSSLTVQVAPSLKAVVGEATDYLKQYPYGCVEQTVSRFVPLIAAGEADKPLVDAGIARLAGLQQGDKGWGWWYKDQTDLFLTAYALWGLAEAREAGYTVPPRLFESGAKPLRTLIESKASPKPETAFALYALSRADGSWVRRQGVGALTQLLKRFGDPSAKRADTLAWLVLFTKTVGLDSEPYVAALEKKAVTDGAFTHWSVPEERWSTTDRMTTALTLRALLKTRPSSPLLAQGVRYLLSTATDGYFGDTRDTAFVVTTLCATPEFQQPESTVVPSLTLNGKPLALAKKGKHTLEVTVRGTQLKAGANALQFTGSGYATATLRQSKRAPEGTLPTLDSKSVTVRREYVTLASGPNGLIPGKPSTQFQHGDTVRVRLIIEAKEPLEYVLLEDRFPAGFEPNARGTVDEEETYKAWSFWYSHIDVRDDRLALFARTLPAGKYVYEYHLRAQTPGTAHALPTALTPMYGTTLRAESTGEPVEIR